MHELALIKRIVENVEAAANKANIKNVVGVRMRVGKMVGFEPEQLNFLFNVYEKSAVLKNAKLNIEEIAVELECPSCKHTFTDNRFDDHSYVHALSHTPYAYVSPSCPKCGVNGSTIIKGKELDLIDLEGE